MPAGHAAEACMEPAIDKCGQQAATTLPAATHICELSEIKNMKGGVSVPQAPINYLGHRYSMDPA